MNNGDLIRREALAKEFNQMTLKCLGAYSIDDYANAVAGLIDFFPAVDAVEVVHAKWVRPTKISGRNFDIPHCSACHEVPCGADGNYCPNCGARMDGE